MRRIRETQNIPVQKTLEPRTFKTIQLQYLKNCRRMARGKSNRVIEHFEDNYQQSAWKALRIAEA